MNISLSMRPSARAAPKLVRPKSSSWYCTGRGTPHASAGYHQTASTSRLNKLGTQSCIHTDSTDRKNRNGRVARTDVSETTSPATTTTASEIIFVGTGSSVGTPNLWHLMFEPRQGQNHDNAWETSK
jgi:hypothetical protein